MRTCHLEAGGGHVLDGQVAEQVDKEGDEGRSGKVTGARTQQRPALQKQGRGGVDAAHVPATELCEASGA